LHSTEEADRANTLAAIDVAVFVHYVEAVDTNNARFKDFLFRRFRPEFVPAMRAWLATNPFQNVRAPSTPFVMPEYRLQSREEALEYEKRAANDFNEAGRANHNADQFVLLTVIFAGVSFLAGISTKMVYPSHTIVVALGLIATAYGAVRLLELPLHGMN
jgi:hypothetical protein